MQRNRQKDRLAGRFTDRSDSRNLQIHESRRPKLRDRSFGTTMEGNRRSPSSNFAIGTLWYASYQRKPIASWPE